MMDEVYMQNMNIMDSLEEGFHESEEWAGLTL